MKSIPYLVCLVLGLSLTLVSQYPTYVMAQMEGEPSDFVTEGDRALNLSRIVPADNVSRLENTTAQPSDFGENEMEDPLEAFSSDFAAELGENMTAAPSDIATEPGGVPTDFGDDETSFDLNTRKIADELIRLTPLEIRQYPITALSVTDIKAVLGFLNSFHLAKVLLNIPGEDLLEVKDMLSPITFNQTIDILSAENRTQVEDRLSTVSAIP